MKKQTDILGDSNKCSNSKMSIAKGGYKMSTFKPEVDYAGLKRNNITCRLCKDSLTCENYGEKINENRGYAPANSYYLAKWGFFCNPCGVQVIQAEQAEYKKNTSKLSKSIN